jgi:hypothetical protein
LVKDVLAAPASFLSVAWATHVGSAKASVGAPARTTARAARARILVVKRFS